MTPIRKWVAYAVAGALLVVSPAYLYSQLFSDPFDYNEADMRRVVDGEWALTSGGTEYRFRIAQATPADRKHSQGVVAPANACTRRTFVRSAGACISESTMAVELVAVAGYPAIRGDGELVAGETLGKVYLRITTNIANLDVTLGRDGTILNPQTVPGFRRVSRR